MSNVYHVLYTRPKLDKKLPKPQEALAQAIVASGRMRLDAGLECNFSRILLPGIMLNQTITHREMNTPELLSSFRQRVLGLLRSKHTEGEALAQLEQYLERAREDLRKRHPVPAQIEVKMARALVLCNELAVIRLIHLEGAEIFISYGQSVGDVMDVVDWQKYGNNNGMQAAGNMQNAIYVSCGGHPFLEGDERNYTTDGFPALARFMVIAAQETGHHADMIRNETGQWVGRHSAKDWYKEPSDAGGKARNYDLLVSDFFFTQARDAGLGKVVEWERHLKFYRDQKVGGSRATMAWLKARLAWLVVSMLLARRGMKALAKLPKNPYPATQVQTYFNDMRFNLSPQADAYMRDNPKETEAVACIEALARIPQQVVKWGHSATYCCAPALYNLYYHTVVPACDAAGKRLMPTQ